MELESNKTLQAMAEKVDLTWKTIDVATKDLLAHIMDIVTDQGKIKFTRRKNEEFIETYPTPVVYVYDKYLNADLGCDIISIDRKGVIVCTDAEGNEMEKYAEDCSQTELACIYQYLVEYVTWTSNKQ